MSEIITTGEALDLLPQGSVVLDSQGDMWLRDGERWVSPDAADAYSDRIIRKWGPVTVLYNPDTERSRLEAAEAEIERLRRLVEAEDMHAALAPGETCDVCVHLEAENLAEQCMAEMDRVDAAEAKLAAVRELHTECEHPISVCHQCQVRQPCPTLRALGGGPTLPWADPNRVLADIRATRKQIDGERP